MDDSSTRLKIRSGPGYILRDFRAGDAAAVNQVALAAFAQYREAYADWAALSRSIGAGGTRGCSRMIVAVTPERIAGAVAYVGPHRRRPSSSRRSGRSFACWWSSRRFGAAGSAGR